MTEQGRLGNTTLPLYFHLVLPHPLWITGKEETGDWEEKMSRADGLTGLSDFAGSVGIDQGDWGKESWVLRQHHACARAEVAKVLAHMTCLVPRYVVACPGVVSSWAESKVCALCDTCLWHASFSESQQSHRHTQLLMNRLVSLNPWWMSLYKKYNLWILVFTGLVFLFITFF